MASRKRSREQMSLVDGIESWYMPAAVARGKVVKILQYAQFVDYPGDLAARRLIELEARETLAMLEQSTARWQSFWSVVYESEHMSSNGVVQALRALREAMDESGRGD